MADILNKGYVSLYTNVDDNDAIPAVTEDELNVRALLDHLGVNPFQILAEIAVDGEDEMNRTKAASELASYVVAKPKATQKVDNKHTGSISVVMDRYVLEEGRERNVPLNMPVVEQNVIDINGEVPDDD